MTQITVSSGQSSAGLTISSGDTLQVNAGGVVYNTHLAEGSSYDDPIETVQGSSVNTQIDYGSQTVEAGGASLSAIVGAEGYQSVENGGSASFTIIQSGGEIDVGGDEAMPTAALAAATSDTVLSGGEATVFGRGVLSGTTVSSGGIVDVQSGGQASGDTISSGGVLFVESGGSASHETIQAGGLIVEHAGAVVTNTDTTGVLAGVVVADDNNHIVSAWIQSGAALNKFDLSSITEADTDYRGLDAVVVAGQTVNGLTMNASMEMEIDGTVNGLTVINGGGGAENVDIYQGGVLEGVVSGTTVYNSGGAVSGVTLVSGAALANTSGAINGLTVESGAQLDMYGGTMANVVVQSGATLYIDTSGAVSAGTVNLGAHLLFDDGFSGQIENNTLMVTSGGVEMESFTIGNLPANANGATPLLKEVTSGSQTYYELDDGTPCYCPGTLIATTRGEVAVEDLQIGDRVVTASGKRRPIRWIGNRAYSGRFAATNPDVLPVLFRAGSLGQGLPRRDLMVSPLHAMYLDGVLVPAQALVNGVSIVRLQQVDRVDYFHIELKTHDILLAEGAPAESFVDDDSRGMFHNAHEYAERYPNERKPAVQYCAPRVEEGPQLEVIRQRLNALPVACSVPVANAG
ncbi:Hint domain-containing protein [Acetobacter malorum]|uniref:Hint domain-containing protein n=1 Tax=Acetobacter malorum TaxID=178901 RepID=UPI0039E944C3